MPRENRFWTARRVAWYRRANARSDYADRVLAVVDDLLARSASALDVGAGFGALALPLASRLSRVTAIEPAREMARTLRDDARTLGLANVTVIEAAWSDVEVAPHDLVLCAHVGPLLGHGAPFLRAVPALARRGVVLVRDVPGGDDKFFFRELYPRLRGEPYERASDYEDTLAAIATLGVQPTVTAIDYASDQPFVSLEEACDFWMEYMRLEGDAPRAFLRDFLRERLTREGAGWIAPFRKRAAVIHWAV
ncbi:MAG: class I SAM-dependent methyltransferase [Candidatus Rokubacteria bacterium]|nr:class I SAM-dependent methyltransferase [Candidatus Rokubacteria bacterium]